MTGRGSSPTDVLRRYRVVRGGVAVSVLLIAVMFFRAIPEDLSAQQIDMDAARAQEEFRWGVEAYHATRFNDAVVAFNRALAFTPDNHRIREWLGNAYFRSGFVDAAISEWEIVAENDAAGAYLRARLDTLRYRRGLMPFDRGDPSFVRSQILRSDRGQQFDFRRPTDIAAEPNGDIFLVSLGTQEVLRITPNGRVRRTLRGGLQGLNRPFGVAWYEGELYVTEFGGNRIAVLNEQGERVRHIGGRGLGEGELLGPQYIAVADGLVYATDWAGRRVSVFTTDGDFVLSFGRETTGYSGLVRPTGVAVARERVFVADFDDHGAVLVVFDTAGNYLERIPLPLGTGDVPENSVTGVITEGLTWYDEDHLLVTAGRRTLLFELQNRRVVAEIDDAERMRVAAAVVDANGRIVVSDVDSSEVGIFEPEGTLYSGLDVRIERILVSRFPEVALLVAVHDRDGKPLVGLSRENFIVSEQGIPQTDVRLESAGQFVRELDISVVLKPRPGNVYHEDATQAVSDIVSAVPDSDRLSLYIAGSEPALILQRPAGRERFVDSTRSALERESAGPADGNLPLDRAIRLATTPLVDRGLRRNMIVIGDGTVGDNAFDEYGLQETAAFLENNDIRLHYVLLQSRTPAAELDFLVDRTGGEIRYAFEPEGTTPLIDRFTEYPSGRYWLTYASEAFPDFGRAYLSVSAEANLFVRSGRDELGFFPRVEE